MAVTPDALAGLQAAEDKWRSRWPEWEVIETFIPSAQRTLAWAWFAWLDELAVAAWSGSEPAPGMAKLAWWQEELRGWAKGARRHPLGMTLQSLKVDWSGIADEMGALRTRDPGREGQVDTLLQTLEGFANKVAEAEQQVLGGDSVVAPARLLRSMLVSAGVAPASKAGTGAQDGSRARRLLDNVCDLRAGAQGRSIGRFVLLWSSWRAARSG